MSRRNEPESIKRFNERLTELGYTKNTISIYITGAMRYMETGNAWDDETVTNYWQGLFDRGEIKVSSRNMHRRGTIAYRDFLKGQSIKPNSRPKKFNGCDEDCFNCPYPDCYRPETLIHESVTEGRALNSYR